MIVQYLYCTIMAINGNIEKKAGMRVDLDTLFLEGK